MNNTIITIIITVKSTTTIKRNYTRDSKIRVSLNQNKTHLNTHI